MLEILTLFHYLAIKYFNLSAIENWPYIFILLYYKLIFFHGIKYIHLYFFLFI